MKKEMKNEKGITLIILVVTIIVILILASITVNIAFQDEGVIKRAEAVQGDIDKTIGSNENRMAQLLNDVASGSIDTGSSLIPDSNRLAEGGGETEGDNDAIPSKPKVTVKGTEGEKGYYRSDIEIVVNCNDRANTLTYTVEGTNIEQGSISTETPIGNGQSIYITQDGTYTVTIYEYNKNGQKSEPTMVTVTRDTVAPNAHLAVTKKGENSITVQFVAIDPEPSSGLATDIPYTFYYQEEGSSTWINAGKGNTSSYTYTGLDKDKNYTLKADVADKAGNIGVSNEAQVVEDTTPPNIKDYHINGTTTSSITVEVDAKDVGEGIKTEGGYTYYISKDSDFPSGKTTVITANDSSYTFTDLQDNTTYYTKVEVTDAKDNTATSQTISGKTGSMPDGTGNITVSNMVWNEDGTESQEGTAKITINNQKPEYKMQYQKVEDGGEKTEDGWIDVEESSIVIDGLHHNDKIYARLVDKAGNSGSITTITILDEENPAAGSLIMKKTDSIGETYINDTWTNQNVYIEIQNGSDAQSGHKTTIVKNNTETLTNPDMIETEGVNTIVVTTTDWAGNTASSVYTIKIDKTAPTITNASTPAPEIIKQGETSTITITTSEPVNLVHPENITVTGEGSSGASVSTQISEDGTTITIIVTGGDGTGEVVVNIPEGSIVDKAGNTMAEQNIEGITVDNLEVVVTTKHNDNSGENYEYGTWSNTNLYSEISAITTRDVEKYQYSVDNGQTWEDISATSGGVSATITFQAGEDKPDIIGDLQNDESYYFEPLEGGGIVSNNTGIDGSVAESYLPIDLTQYPAMEFKLNIHTTISSERSYDKGYIIISPDYPYNSENATTVFRTSGVNYDEESEIPKEEIANLILEGGKEYYIHFQYDKDGSDSAGNDTFIINSIDIRAMIESSTYITNFIEETNKPDYIGELQQGGETYYFEVNEEGGITSNGLSADSYIPIDLTRYPNDVINISIQASAKGNISAYIDITNSSETPEGESPDKIEVGYIDGNGEGTFSTTLNGGELYYLHFDCFGENVEGNAMTIHSLKVQHYEEGDGEIRFAGYAKNNNNITFSYKDNLDIDIQYRAVCTDGTISQPTQNYSIKIDKQKPKITQIEGPLQEVIKQGDTSTITIHLSEPVELINKENIVLSGSTGSTIETSIDETGTIITIIVTGGTGDGEIAVTIPEGCLIDKAGNSLIEKTLPKLTIDNIAPTIVNQQGPEPTTIYEGKTSTTILTFDEPVVIQAPENITVTGTASEGCTVESNVSEDGLTVTIIVTGGTGQGDIEITIPEGVITDRAGNQATEHTITGIHVDNIAPELILKYNDSTGEEYPQGTWTNQNVYTEVNIDESSTVNKYQYTLDGSNWFTLSDELVDSISMDYTMTFPTDDTKPSMIGDVTPSHETYYFVDNGNGGIVSNNQGVHSSVASMYIPINLKDYEAEQALHITINATCSGESGCDYGFAMITESTEVPSSNDSNRFMYGTGSATTTDYTTTITGGKLYYLHIGYRKDSSVNKYNDECVINSIRFQSDVIEKQMNFYNYTKNDNQITYTLQDEIKNPMQIRAVYTDGKTSKPITSDVKIDKTAPIIDTIQAYSYESLSEGTVEVTVVEKGQVESYYISTDSTDPTDDSNWVAEENNPFTISGIQADTTYYVWVKDKAGNLSEMKEFQITQANYQIDTNGYSATLAEAIEEANENSVIKLLRDYTDESTVNFTKNLTFDTSNYTLIRYEKIIMSNGKNVVLQGNGKITGGVHNLIHNVSTLTIKGNITIESRDGTALDNYATMYIQDEATIFGSKAINNTSGGTVKVEGGNIKAAYDGIYGGIIQVTGGKVEGNRYGVWGNRDNDITIGDSNQPVSERNPIIYGKIVAVKMNNEPVEQTFNFYNGKLMADGKMTYTGIPQIREGYTPYTYYGYEERAYCTILGTEVSEIQIQAEPLTWTNQDVTITIYYPNLENTIRQYSLDGINWVDATTTKVMTNVTENTTVYARILNNNQVVLEEAETIIDYIDKIAPEVSIEPATTRYYITDEQPTVNINFTIQVDEQGGSGINIKQYAWTTGEEQPTYITFENGMQVQRTLGEGNYYLWLQVTDKAGNIAELRKVPFVVEYQEPVAQIGDTTYTTIQAAIDDCEDNTQTTIIMLKGTDEEVNIPETKNVILDLQGYTVGSYNQNSPIFQNAGILQIIDTSTEKTGILNHYIGTAIQNTGTLTIGDNASAIENATPTIKGAKIGIQNTATFNYYDGAISSKAPINGNITDTPEGYGPVASYENNITTVTLGIVSDYVARIEYHYYTTLQNAIDACVAKENNINQQEITILKDIVLDKTATVYKGQNIKLDLDGYSISSSTIDKGIINNGNLELTDESVRQTGKIEISSSESGTNDNNRKSTLGLYNTGEGKILISRRKSKCKHKWKL